MKNAFLSQPKTLIMGILNVTPDSFSDGGLYHENLEAAFAQTQKMLHHGADIIDIGGESTRPGSEFISVEEELLRVIPVIEGIRKRFGSEPLLSIDTYKAEVASQALNAGVDFVNSLGGFSFDTKLVEVIARKQCPIMIYHIKGQPKTMQRGDIHYTNVVSEILDFFTTQIEYGISHGLVKEQFLLDPGIGFGKKLEHNLEIIKNFAQFSSLNLPTVIGVSRKSHLSALLQEALDLKEPPGVAERLEASLAETAAAVMRGAKIVRTHDVLETKKFLATLDRVR